MQSSRCPDHKCLTNFTNSAVAWQASTMPLARCPPAGTADQNVFWKTVRRWGGAIGHGTFRRFLDSGDRGSSSFLRHHRRRKNSPEFNPAGSMAEMLPCSETQACGCFPSSHRTCHQLPGDFDSRQSVHCGSGSGETRRPTCSGYFSTFGLWIAWVC